MAHLLHQLEDSATPDRPTDPKRDHPFRLLRFAEIETKNI